MVVALVVQVFGVTDISQLPAVVLQQSSSESHISPAVLQVVPSAVVVVVVVVVVAVVVVVVLVALVAVVMVVMFIFILVVVIMVPEIEEQSLAYAIQ